LKDFKDGFVGIRGNRYRIQRQVNIERSSNSQTTEAVSQEKGLFAPYSGISTYCTHEITE
jgi:hypothetical protein